MAKRPLKRASNSGDVPLDQEITLDVREDDPVITITKDADTEPPDREQEPPPPRPDDDTVSLRKQIEDLRKAEEAARTQAAEWERQHREAQQRANELEQQNSQHQNTALEAEYDSILNAMSAAEAESNAAAQAYDAAFQAGDGKLMAEAQRKLSRAEARLEGLEQGKNAIESRIEAAKSAPPPDRRVSSDPFESYVSQFPGNVQTWMRGHKEYIVDPSKNAKLQVAHYAALEHGKTLNSNEYIEDIEVQLGLRQAPDTDDDDDPPRRTPVSAPVSRDVPSASTGTKTPTKVTLTPQEREIARTSNLSNDPAEAERIYAQQKLKMLQAKANGFYNER